MILKSHLWFTQLLWINNGETDAAILKYLFSSLFNYVSKRIVHASEWKKGENIFHIKGLYPLH